MDPLVLLRLVAFLVIWAMCWEGLFATFPYGFGPWFIGSLMFWIDHEGLHWRNGRRFHKR